MVLRHPDSRIVMAVEHAAGVQFPDPYRWLEDDTEEVGAWQRSQADLAMSHVRAWPGYGAVRDLVDAYARERSIVLPRYAAGAWFRAHTPTGASYPQVIASDTPYGDGRVVVDLAEVRVGADLPVLSWISPSPDGRVLAFGVCTDGSEHNTMRLVDVATGEPLDSAPEQVLHDAWTGGAVWLPDSSGFYFVGLTGPAHEFQQAVFAHRLGDMPATTLERLPAGTHRQHGYTLIQVSRDGRWAVAVSGNKNPAPVAVRDLSDPRSEWRPFMTSVDGTVAGHVLDGNYIAITDIGAPRGRLVAISLEGADPNDPSGWTELIGESHTVLRTVTPVADWLYLTELDDTYAAVRIVDREGTAVGVVALPGRGAILEPSFPIMTLVPRGHPDEFVFAFSMLTSSWAVYRHRPGDPGIETLRPATITMDALIDDHTATSSDGTAIPYHVVRLAATPAAAPLPTLLYAYGGFNSPFMPQYPSAMAGFVAAGGVLVHAHLRGGGEFGRDWWEGGRQQNKANCYADLYAVAEDLVRRGITTRGQLGLTGVSNGGLMCGVAITQRPDLWQAVVPQVPLLDLIGALRDPYDAYAISSEFANPEIPAEIKRLAAFSPYHLVRDDTSYPAVFISAGDNDPRCPAWHSRKFAARLQAAQAGEAPVLLHVWEDAGHGAATHQEVALEQTSEWLTFLFMTLGLSP